MRGTDVDAGFTGWVAFVFDREGRWFDDPFLEDRSATPAETVAHMTRLFDDAGARLAPFDADQAGWGLYYLVGVSDAMHALRDPRVAWRERESCLRALTALYADVFATRCSQSLGHLAKELPPPLDTTCYMWWDLFPTWGRPGDPADRDFDATALAVLEQLLDIDSPACRESALHGLGHWHVSYPKRVEQIVDRFLERTTGLDPPLAAYARAARTGCVN